MGFFFDFGKDFDKVDHENILHILHSLGLRGNIHALMASSLAAREPLLNVNSESSNLRLVDRGVPNESLLGPLQFLVYINDIGLNANITGNFAICGRHSSHRKFIFGDWRSEIITNLVSLK